MSTTSKEESARSWLCGLPGPPLPKFFKRKKTQPQESLPIEKPARDDQATLRDELAEEKARSARLEAEAAAEKTNLEDELRQCKELLETRVKELGLKDADIRRLGKEGDVMRARVSSIEKGTSPNS